VCHNTLSEHYIFEIVDKIHYGTRRVLKLTGYELNIEFIDIETDTLMINDEFETNMLIILSQVHN
jgi:hypothetical protein